MSGHSHAASRSRPLEPESLRVPPTLAERLERAARFLESPQLVIDQPPGRLRLRIGGTVWGRSEPRAPDWIADWDGQALSLRRWRHEDAPPELELRVLAHDLERHLSGELDLAASALPRVRFLPMRARRRAGGRARAGNSELEALARRLLALLALAEQSDERFRGGPIEALYLRHGSPREDGADERMGNWSLPFLAGKGLYELVRREGLERTLEVGMAHGSSTLFIAQAMRDSGSGPGAMHVAIDPWQAHGFGRAGVLNVRQAGLEGYVQVLEQPNHVALPRLAEQRAGDFQLAFVDGLHVFDHVVLDLFYCDLLLGTGGYLVFDDTDLPAVAAAVDFFVTNRGEDYEELEELSGERVRYFRKLAADGRVDRGGVRFHRDFLATARPLPSLPPARPHHLKRALDLALALPAVLLTLPVVLACALVLAVESLSNGSLAWPLRAVQRVSRGRAFGLLRLRTRTGAPPAPTRVGRLFEALRLDRLPELWNVLRGDLSLVGPAPRDPRDPGPAQAAALLDLFRGVGLRAGLVGPQDAGGTTHGGEYYHDYTERAPLSLLAHDLGLCLRALLRRERRQHP